MRKELFFAALTVFCLISFWPKSIFGSVFLLIKQEEIPIDHVQGFIDSIANTGIDGILIDAYTDGLTLFPSEGLDFTYSYDILEEIVYCAGLKELLVFFNLDLFRIWTRPFPPTSASHVFHMHRDWILKDATGRSMSSFSIEDLSSKHAIDGYYVSPANREYAVLLYEIMTELTGKYPYSGIVISGICIPGQEWAYDDYTLTEFMRLYYVNPNTDRLTPSIREEWFGFNQKAAENFLKRFLVTAEIKGFVAVRIENDSNLSSTLVRSDAADFFIPDSNWIKIKRISPKDLADIIKARGDNEFIVLDNARDALRIIGYKEMIKIAMEWIRGEGARR